jgi:transcriptional regulator with XRE-family HTH domain
MNRKLKAMLIEKGIKQIDIAREMGVTKGTISGAIGGHHNSRAVKMKVAELLKVDIEKIERLWSKAA